MVLTGDYVQNALGRATEAEAVRDAVLAVSGRLNPEQYGLPIFPPLPEGLAEEVKFDDSKWDTQDGPEGRKRSISSLAVSRDAIDVVNVLGRRTRF